MSKSLLSTHILGCLPSSISMHVPSRGFCPGISPTTGQNVGQKARAFDYMTIHKRRTCFDASCFGTPPAGVAVASSLLTRILCCIIKDAQSTAEAGCIDQSRGAETHGINIPRREGPPCEESTCPQRCVRPRSGTAIPCPVPRTGRDRLRRELGTKVLRNQAPGLCGRDVGRRAPAPAALPAEHRLRAPLPSSLLPPSACRSCVLLPALGPDGPCRG
jgi:hypothetical protein